MKTFVIAMLVLLTFSMLVSISKIAGDNLVVDRYVAACDVFLTAALFFWGLSVLGVFA